MDNYEIVNNVSNQEFESARFRSLLTSLKYFLVGRNNELLSFEKIKKGFEIYKQKYLGIQTIPIDAIVGSFDRYKDFDRYFLPKKAHLQQRWAKIHNLIARDVILPPVKLYKIGEIYFVIDGNHRVSASKKLGVKYIDAEVIEFITDISITPNMDPKEIFILAEREKFLNVTGLRQNRPEIKIRITVLGQYDFLLSQIDKLMVQLNENKKADEKLTTFKETSLIWYDHIYLSAIEIIKNYGILEKFPNRTKTDLYVWINEHKRYLSLKYGREVVIKFAAKDFLLRYSKNPFRRFKLRLINLKYRNYKNFYNRKAIK
ncbi:MAG: ParB N-terminal domain-containing protein [Actinobacteria bacterium]|nr:ParB N-terminal domain-containing protein [Actinomycetota bacterium]